MLRIKTVILVTQVARIWSRNRLETKVLQTLASIAFFALYLKNSANERERVENQEFNGFNKDL